MKAFEIQHTFGLDSIVSAVRPDPTPGPHEVLLKMKAVSLNYRDLSVIKGNYHPQPKLPLIPISDGVGEVVAVGKQVSRIRPGDRVSPIYAQKWLAGVPDLAALQSTIGSPADGLLAEYAVLHEDGLVHVPQHLTDEEAATLPCAGVTAWHAAVTEGQVQAGDVVVIQGTGNVSLFALQFAKMHGAKVIITSGRDEKLAKAACLGADHGVNYRTRQDWDQAVLEYTEGRGADLIIDVGGAETLAKSLSAIRIGGRISVVGILTGVKADGIPILGLMQKKPTIQGIYAGSREMFTAMNRGIEQNKMRPVIDRVFPFEQSVEALHYKESGNLFGKVCITI